MTSAGRARLLALGATLVLNGLFLLLIEGQRSHGLRSPKRAEPIVIAVALPPLVRSQAPELPRPDVERATDQQQKPLATPSMPSLKQKRDERERQRDTVSIPIGVESIAPAASTSAPAPVTPAASAPTSTLNIGNSVLSEAAKQARPSAARALVRSTDKTVDVERSKDEVLSDAIRKTLRPDCKEAYSEAGLLALPALIKDALQDKGCRW